MMRASFGIACTMAVLGLVSLRPAPVVAQSPTPPLTSWGAPDLQGAWDFRSLTPMERPRELGEVFTAEQAAEFSQEEIQRRSRDSETSERAARAAQGDIIPYNDFWFDEGTKVTTARTSLIVDPPDGRRPPLTPEAERRRAAREEARRGLGPDEPPPGGGAQDLSPTVRCIVGFNSGPPMNPSAYNNNMQLFQTQNYVVILTEMVHDARIVPLDGRPHLPQHLRQWMGDSRGRWEGRTLVVETTNFRPDRTPSGSTETVHLIERFTRVDRNTLLYEATVDDPRTWAKSWTFQVPMARTQDHLYEYACHEGNYGLYNILAGAVAKK